MKEKEKCLWAAMGVSFIIHLTVVPWIVTAVNTFAPEGWWTGPLHCSMIAIFLSTLILLAAFINYKIEDE